jgi:hypothetical protein
VRRLALVLLAALIGCGSPDDGGSSETAVDAATAGDAPLDPIGAGRTPFMTTGTTPAGSLDDVRFIEYQFVGGHCPGVYYVTLYRTDAPGELPSVLFTIPIPPNAMQPPTGTIMASAQVGDDRTDQVRFEIVQLDLPPADDAQSATLRIAGRITISMGAWNIDFTVDATTPSRICLIF